MVLLIPTLTKEVNIKDDNRNSATTTTPTKDSKREGKNTIRSSEGAPHLPWNIYLRKDTAMPRETTPGLGLMQLHTEREG